MYIDCIIIFDMEEEEGEDLLYGDIADAALQDQVEKLQTQLIEEQKEKKALRDENAQLKEQMQALLKDSKQLEVNIMAIYNTALREIKRKDTGLQELRAELLALRSSK